MMQVDENQQDTNIPIIFPEWSLIMSTKLKRRDFRLDVLLKANPLKVIDSFKEVEDILGI